MTATPDDTSLSLRFAGRTGTVVTTAGGPERRDLDLARLGDPDPLSERVRPPRKGCLLLYRPFRLDLHAGGQEFQYLFHEVHVQLWPPFRETVIHRDRGGGRDVQ